MGKSLVIVESPAKAKTINRYLGKDYVVRSSVGHVRDLPVSGSRKKVDPKKRAQQAARTRLPRQLMVVLVAEDIHQSTTFGVLKHWCCQRKRQ